MAITNGTYGNYMTWALDDSTGLLTINASSGTVGDGGWVASSVIDIRIYGAPTNISDAVFRNCTNLKSILIPKTITKFGWYAFEHCTNLTDVYFRGNENEWSGINKGTYNTPILNATVHYNYILIIDSGNCGDNATYVLDENGLLIISGTGATMDNDTGNEAPWKSNDHNIKTVIIEESITSIGNGLFYLCTDLQNIDLPTSLVTISSSAFHSCSSLTNITIPDGVTSIGERAFYGCENLKTIVIPETMTQIGENAFANCKNLKYVYYKGAEEQWNDIYIDRDTVGNERFINAQRFYNSIQGSPTITYNEKQENGRYQSYSVKTTINDVEGLKEEYYTQTELDRQINNLTNSVNDAKTRVLILPNGINSIALNGVNGVQNYGNGNLFENDAHYIFEPNGEPDFNKVSSNHFEGIGQQLYVPNTSTYINANHFEGYQNMLQLSDIESGEFTANHFEGYFNMVNGNNLTYNHVEGMENSINVDGIQAAHIEGQGNKVTASYTHVGGIGNTAVNEAETVIGKYAIEDTTGEALFVVGNGESDTERNNAFVVDKYGNGKLLGDIVFGSNNTSLNNLYGVIQGLQTQMAKAVMPENLINISYLFADGANDALRSKLDTSYAVVMDYTYRNFPYSSEVLVIVADNCTSMQHTFDTDAQALETTCTSIEFKNGTPLLNLANHIFYGCEDLTNITGFNATNVTNLSYGFYKCKALTSVDLVSSANVTNMSYAFYDSGLTTIEGLDTSSVTNLDGAFGNTPLTSLTLDCDNVTTAKGAFAGCSSLANIELNGMKVSFNVSDLPLNGTTLNTLFTSLGTASTGATITIPNTIDENTYDKTIAETKGWTII